MPVEDVSVSLSRLALAKAIKTPDTDEKEAEPWNKSVIFHQSHIDAHMRNSIINPMSNKNKHRLPHKAQERRMPPTSNMYPLKTSKPPLDQIKQNHPMNSKSGRKYIPSDEEEEEDESEESEESEDEEPATTPIKKNASIKGNKVTTLKPMKEEVVAIGKERQLETEATFARRMSTLRQLEQGSVKSRSTDSSTHKIEPPTTSFMDPTTMPPISEGKLGTIEQWRMTVMESEDTASTPGSTSDDTERSNKRQPTPNPMEMYYLQQQQQQMYQLQLQQAMQMQQYQLQLQQQYQQQARINHYRGSVMIDKQQQQRSKRNTKHDRHSQMISPMPTMSMSTPTRQSMMVPQPYMMMPVMKPSRSSHMSKRYPSNASGF